MQCEELTIIWERVDFFSFASDHWGMGYPHSIGDLAYVGYGSSRHALVSWVHIEESIRYHTYCVLMSIDQLLINCDA